MVLHFILTIFIVMHWLAIDRASFIVQNVFRQAWPHKIQKYFQDVDLHK